MDAPYPLVLTKQYQTQAPKWLETIKNGESLAIVFFPKTDRLRRLQQLIEDKVLLKRTLPTGMKHIFQMTDFSTVNIEDKFDMEDYLVRQWRLSRIVSQVRNFHEALTYFKTHNLRMILVLYEAEKYLTPGTKHVLNILSHLLAECTSSISALSLFETDITDPMYFNILPSSTSIYDNVSYYPLYTHEEALVFVRYLEKKWDITLSLHKEEQIVDQCGGHFWLVKEAVREVSDSGEWSIEKAGIRFRINAIYNSLSSNEKSVLHKISLGRNDFNREERHSLLYLKKMRILDSKNNSLIPSLQNFVTNQHESAVILKLVGNHILLNKVPIDTFFSRKEQRVLKLFLERTGEIVSRDIIGEKLWPTNTSEHYSDWAIDQTIRRIRRRLVELSLSKSLIQSLRGKGYKLVLPSN